MYGEMKYSRACYKLLNASGPVGCEAKDGKIITAPIVHAKDLGSLATGPRAVLVPATDADDFLRDLLADPELQGVVAAVLVDMSGDRPAHQSVALRAPGSAYAPYPPASRSYAWNPSGSGLGREWLGLPVFALNEAMANETLWRADYNAKHKLKGGRHMARMALPMTAVGNSSHCIAQGVCLPVGGYGVWSALPPIPDPSYASPANPPLPITLVVAQMDSNSLFHDLTRAASTSLSGLVASMAALTMLARAGHAPSYSRRIVFAALAGEAFDFMGSRRLLYEMSYNSSFTRGLRLDLIDQVVEVGMVGGAFSAATNASTLYLHTQRGGDFGDATPLTDAALAAAAHEAPQVAVSLASAANPGVPPSSLYSLLRARPSLAGMVLTDFDTAIKAPYYQSDWDVGYNVTVQALTDTALLLARTLHALASGPDTPPALDPPRALARALVADLAVCLLLDSPGMRCPTAAALMSPDVDVFYDGSSQAVAKGYPGVLSWLDADPRASRSKPNLARFVFNYLGNVTAVPLPASAASATPTVNASAMAEGSPCDTTVNLCPPPLACIGWRFGTKQKDVAGMGRCRNTTTAYVPAYSTRFWYGQLNGVWRWRLTNASAAWEAAGGWPADPAWAESDWPARTPWLQVFQQESRLTQIATLVAGLLLTAAAAGAAWGGRAAFERHLKAQ